MLKKLAISLFHCRDSLQSTHTETVDKVDRSLCWKWHLGLNKEQSLFCLFAVPEQCCVDQTIFLVPCFEFYHMHIHIWVKSCRTGKKCSECLKFTLTQRVALSKPFILQTWVFYPVGNLCLGHLHKNFHVPGTIFKGLKFKGKKIQNGQFF